MFHYLAPYVGVGTDDDPFRPRGSEQPGWSAIDLRANSTVLTGRALMAVSVRDDTIGAYLGDAPDEISAAIKTAIESRFGITLSATRLRQIIPELLIAHAREDGTRWRPLRAEINGMFRIYLGGLWWQGRSLSGGSTITESFNTADSDTLGPDLTWTEISGDMDVAGNQLNVSSFGTALARAETDLATVNQYAQIVSTTLTRGDASSVALIVLCRMASATSVDFYQYRNAISATINEHQMHKLVNSISTQLGSSDLTDFAVNEVLYIEANGSAITGKRNGAVSIGPITDTAIDGTTVGGKRAGVRAFRGSVANTGVITGDSFQAGDLAVAAGGAHGAMYPRMQRHIHQSWTVPRIG